MFFSPCPLFKKCHFANPTPPGPAASRVQWRRRGPASAAYATAAATAAASATTAPAAPAAAATTPHAPSPGQLETVAKMERDNLKNEIDVGSFEKCKKNLFNLLFRPPTLPRSAPLPWATGAGEGEGFPRCRLPPPQPPRHSSTTRCSRRRWQT